MSHFAVCVVTKEVPSERVLSTALQPFHEFECTGENDKYVQDIDETEKKRAEYASSTTKMVRKTIDGAVVELSAYDESFYRDATEHEMKQMGHLIGGAGVHGGMVYASRDWGDGKGCRTKVFEVPEDWEHFERPASESLTFAQWLDQDDVAVVPFGEEPDTEDKEKHKYSYYTVDQAGEVLKVVRRTNPNKRWDWYVVGGRYSGRLDVNPRPTSGVAMGGSVIETTDWARKSELRLDSMLAGNKRERQQSIQLTLGRINERRARNLEPRLTMEEMLAIDAQLIATYHDDYAPKHAADPQFWFPQWFESLPEDHPMKVHRAVWDNMRSSFSAEVPTEIRDPQAWIDSAPAFSCWAFLLPDGQWIERGEMGWWGMHSGDVTSTQWQESVAKIFESIPDDHYLTIVDCHI